MSTPSPPVRASATAETDTDPDINSQDQQVAEAKIDTVIYSFLEAYPEPTDDQVHRLATILGLTPEEFETRIFEMFSEELDTLDDDEDELDDEDALEEDDIDVFLIAYFAVNPSPTEDQVHALASLVGVSAEDLEARIYRMLADLTSEDEDEEDD